MILFSLIDFNSLKDRIIKHDLLTMAAALAFYTALALSPVMILLLSFLGSLNLGLQQELLIQVQNMMGTEAASVLETIILSSTGSKSLIAKADAWSLAVVLFSGSIIFSQLQSSLNVIFESAEPAPVSAKWWNAIGEYVIRRLVCIGVMVTFVAISVVSLAGSTFLSLVVTSEFKGSIAIVHHILSFGVYSGVFALVFRWMPDRKVSWRATLQGGAITAVLFVLGKILIGVYLGQAAVGSAYGAAGSFVVFLVWIYYSSVIVFLGAEFSALLSPTTKFKSYRRVGAEVAMT